MANPTTNYGFVLPTPTDLVTDLPADFDVALQGVDTRLKALQPGTTLGDIAYSSATANTNTRLPVGTNGQLLTVSSGVPAWTTLASAGGMTLLSTTTLSGTSTTISSIPQGYKALVGYVYGIGLTTGSDNPAIKPNNVSATAFGGIMGNTLDADGVNWVLTTGLAEILGSNTNNAFYFQIDDYASTTNWKPINSYGAFVAPGTVNRIARGGGAFRDNTAVTSLVFYFMNGLSYSSGTVKLYGVN